MIVDLLHSPRPEGYGEALIPLADAKAHLGQMANDDSDDPQIAILRDAAIGAIETHCAVRLAPCTGLEWTASALPANGNWPIWLGVSPVTAITAIAWLNAAGDDVAGDPGDYLVFSRGDVFSRGGRSWPATGGRVTITFDAGFPPGCCPAELLHAARLMLGHLWLHRDEPLDDGAAIDMPAAVTMLCRLHRRVKI